MKSKFVCLRCRDACFEVFAVDDLERNEQIIVKMITLDEAHRSPRQRMVGFCVFLSEVVQNVINFMFFIRIYQYIYLFLHAQTIPTPGKGVQRMVVDGSLLIRPLGPHSSFLSLLWHENSRMKIPMAMADFATR